MDEWKEYKIGEIGSVIGGGTPPTNEPSFYGGNVSWITPKDLSNHESMFIERGERNITEGGLNNSSARLLPAGSVLFTSRAPIGYVAIAKNKVSTNQGFKSIICNKKLVSNLFLYYWLKQHKEDIKSVSSGSTFGEVSGSTMKEIKIILPPLQEQHSIAKILSSLDKKIELNNKMNKNLEAIGQALFKKWFIDNPEREGWEEKPLDEVAEFLNGLALQKYPAKEGEEFLPAIKIRELRNGITEQTDKANLDLPEKYIINNGDVLFSWSGSLEVVIWTNGKGALNQHLFKVSSNEYPKWFYYFWTKHHLAEFRNIAEDKATTMGHIQRRHLTESEVLVPDKKSLEEMDKIMNPLVDRIINLRLESQTLAQIRDALLPKLMSGEVRVR